MPPVAFKPPPLFPWPFGVPPFAAPPGTPAFVPPGDAESFALRFPFGISILGDGGAGFAESETSRRKLESPPESLPGIAGAAPASPEFFCTRATGPPPELVPAEGIRTDDAPEPGRARPSAVSELAGAAFVMDGAGPASLCEPGICATRALLGATGIFRAGIFEADGAIFSALEFGALFSICGTAASSGRRACITGALAGFTGILRSGILLPDCARFAGSAGCESWRMSGAAADSRCRFFKMGASADAEICSFGGAAGVDFPHSTIFGSCGTTFGGSGDASGWIKVWRGCVTRCGCDKIV